MTAALQLHLAERAHSIPKRMLRIISFIIYDDKAADAGCAVAAECRSHGEHILSENTCYVSLYMMTEARDAASVEAADAGCAVAAECRSRGRGCQ